MILVATKEILGIKKGDILDFTERPEYSNYAFSMHHPDDAEPKTISEVTLRHPERLLEQYPDYFEELPPVK